MQTRLWKQSCFCCSWLSSCSPRLMLQRQTWAVCSLRSFLGTHIASKRQSQHPEATVPGEFCISGLQQHMVISCLSHAAFEFWISKSQISISQTPATAFLKSLPLFKSPADCAPQRWTRQCFFSAPRRYFHTLFSSSCLQELPIS